MLAHQGDGDLQEEPFGTCIWGKNVSCLGDCLQSSKGRSPAAVWPDTLGQSDPNLAPRGFPRLGMMELKAAAALAGYHPCHEPATLWSLGCGC